MKMLSFITIAILFFALTGLAQESELRPNLPDDPRWAKFQDLRIYQIMVEAYRDGDPGRNYEIGYGPSSHRGDLRGVIEALPYIRNLGMNAIWLTPIFDSVMERQDDPRVAATGYFPCDYFRIDPKVGTFSDARELVQTAHRLGLYVFFDGVFGHHCGTVTPSPGGKLPVSDGRKVRYPESLDFYTEVALYWIDTLEIDGWRLDQAYQVPPESWISIREAIEAKCASRKAAGKQWGTLGYLVAEVWDGEAAIAKAVYGSATRPVLYSAFDFPLRYRLAEVLAVQENGSGRSPASLLNEGYVTRQAYPATVLPNLMITNHDLVRFGDLIQRAGWEGPDHPDYWKRHRCALSFLAAHSGPITLYYGDEYGAELPGFAAKVTERCWEIDRCDDHVARSSGKIDGFSREERDLLRFTSSLMHLREAHPALARGVRQHLYSDTNLYVDLKSYGDEKIVFALNVSRQPGRIPLSIFPTGCVAAVDLFSGERQKLPPPSGSVEVPALSPLFLLLEE